MRLAGNHAEVAACCAEWEFKSKLNYAFQELGNSIGKETRREGWQRFVVVSTLRLYYTQVCFSRRVLRLNTWR
jgi:hypothetical protein